MNLDTLDLTLLGHWLVQSYLPLSERRGALTHLSNTWFTTYRIAPSNALACVVRGTQMDPTDLIADVHLFTGLAPYTTRFTDAQHMLDRVMHRYPRFPIVTVGHSLGGSIAATLYNFNPRVKAAYLFNAPTTHSHSYVQRRDQDHVHVVTVPGDWLAAEAMDGQTQHEVVQTQESPHSSKNFYS